MTKTKRARSKPHNIITIKPLARFYYKGKHSHPVRRTVLIIEEGANLITGYELREGSQVRSLAESMKHIKTFRKDKIANWGDYGRLRMSSKNVFKDPEESTLERLPITDFFHQGA